MGNRYYNKGIAALSLLCRCFVAAIIEILCIKILIIKILCIGVMLRITRARG